MAVYILDPDEAVIMQATDIRTSGGNADLVLTSKNLIQVNKNFFGKARDAIKYPLSDLKTLNGKANVLIEKERNGSKQLKLYFISTELQFNVQSASKWANAIVKAHKERMNDISKSCKAAKAKGTLLGTIKGTVESAKNMVIGPKVPVRKSCKCSKCGAELTGNRGEEVTCPYCDSSEIIR